MEELKAIMQKFFFSIHQTEQADYPLRRDSFKLDLLTNSLFQCLFLHVF